ncbi:MAG: hypothetical protein NTW87_32805 [Planctomycetota bacterium]|nr:hypothetical protein [Planctomycetota bacterium]
MRLAGLCPLVLAACIASAAYARQEGVCITFIFYPPAQPAARNDAKPAAAAAVKPPVKQMDEATRRQIAERAREAQEAEERLARQVFLKAVSQQPPIDPEKDEYRKYLLEKQRKEEAESDPVVAEIRAQYRADDQDEFRKWKESQAPKLEKAREAPAKELDWSAWLGGVRPREKAQPKDNAAEDE